MAINILATLVFLFMFTASVSAKIAVLHSHDSDNQLAQNLTVRLNTYAPSQRFFINDAGAIPYIQQTYPNIELFVIVSARVASDYAVIVREGRQRLAPHVSILGQNIPNDKLSVLLRHGIVAIPKLDPVLAVRGVSSAYNINIKSVGYLHCDDTRNLAENERAHLLAAQISTANRRMRCPIAVRDFENTIYRFYENEISVVRLLNSQMFLSFLHANPNIIALVERLTAVLLVDSREFVRMFPHAPVAVMEPNEQITERVAAMIIIAKLRETASRPRFSHPITIRSSRVLLFDNDRRTGENISAEFENRILTQIDRTWRQITMPNLSGNDTWALISQLGSLIDKSAATNTPPSAFVVAKNEIIAGINSVVETLIFGYTALAIIVIMLISNISKLFKRKKYKRKIAMLIPSAISKIKLVGSEGHSVSLKFLLESEGYRIKKAGSKGSLKKNLRKNFPNVLVADWESAGTTLQSCYLEFTKSPKFKQMVIILVNIPINKQTQVKKLYEGTSVHCYEDVSTLDEILVHLRGDKHFSSSSEGCYMSGIIMEDNLTAILQMIEGNMLTGCLVVEEDKPISVIYFRGGRVVYSVDKSGESGVKAIYNALSCRRGGFYFHLNRAAQNETLNLGTMEILMGWADQRDRFTEKVKAIDGKSKK
ncbi:MAG: DUF4388 domain-containing protein [Chitinivibrionia bacterium]|nr:DUF4388 domain-containing protein [Chitinivibrionia bacterium]